MDVTFQNKSREDMLSIWAWEDLKQNPWEKLVSHQQCVSAERTLVETRNRFRARGAEYMAVLQGRKVLGLCSFRSITDVLSRGHHGLGFSLYERRPISDFLLPEDFRIHLGDPVHSTLDRLASRKADSFFDDVIVLDANDQFYGIIRAQDLVHFQHSLLKRQQQVLESNIDELSATTKQLNASNQNLKKLNNEKNEFLGIAAHDLKNPINLISMSVDLILSDEAMPTNQRNELLSDVNTSCERMVKLLGDLLDINRIENDSFEYELTSCDVEQTVLMLLEVAGVHAERKDIKIHYDCASRTPPSILADESALNQVLENLLSNAVKFSPLGKQIFVSIGTESETGYIRIRDEGPGFSEKDRQKVFQKFARLSAKPTAEENSTGLGLSIVKKLTEQMGGEIELKSQAGKGATFTLRFPLATQQMSGTP